MDENVAQACSEKMSKGLVNRTAEQCRSRYEFLVNREFEGF